MKPVAICLTIALLSSASLALGQCAKSGYRPSTGSGYGVPAHHYGFGAPVAGHVHHASTVFESVCRGRAAMIQAQAQYNLLTSLAMMNMAEAQRMQWENEQAISSAKIAKAEAIRQKQAKKRSAHRQTLEERTIARTRAGHGQGVPLAQSR